ILTSKLTTPSKLSTTFPPTCRRDFLSLTTLSIITPLSFLFLSNPAWAASADEYIKETEEVINKVRSMLTLDQRNSNVAEAVAYLRDTSNYWVAKYRREKDLLGKASFWDMYSALNDVSGHYISFGRTAPIPEKRKQRILEEMDTAEKALLRGR
ncbi:hypothetical protein Leryth_025888, partial [Lithospermum erythrorhizon]